MSGTISACENICRDFSWASAAWSWFAQTLQQLGPALTLLGAVYLYFKKEKAERQAELRKDRRQLFARYLSAINEVWNTATDGPAGLEGPSQIIRLGGIRNELALVADESVVACALETHQALGAMMIAVLQVPAEIWRSEGGAAIPEWPQLVDRVVTGERALVTAMKRDLGELRHMRKEEKT